MIIVMMVEKKHQAGLAERAHGCTVAGMRGGGEVSKRATRRRRRMSTDGGRPAEAGDERGGTATPAGRGGEGSAEMGRLRDAAGRVQK